MPASATPHSTAIIFLEGLSSKQQYRQLHADKSQLPHNKPVSKLLNCTRNQVTRSTLLQLNLAKLYRVISKNTGKIAIGKNKIKKQILNSKKKCYKETENSFAGALTYSSSERVSNSLNTVLDSTHFFGD